MLTILYKKHPPSNLLTQKLQERQRPAPKGHLNRFPSQAGPQTGSNEAVGSKSIWKDSKQFGSRVGQSSKVRMRLLGHGSAGSTSPGLYSGPSGPVLIGAHTGLKGRKQKRKDHQFHNLHRKQFFHFFRQQVNSNLKCSKSEAKQIKRTILWDFNLPPNSSPQVISQQDRYPFSKPGQATVQSNKKIKEQRLPQKKLKKIYSCLKIERPMTGVNKGTGLDLDRIGKIKVGQSPLQCQPLHSDQDAWSINESLAFQSLRIAPPSTSDRAPSSGLSISIPKHPSQLNQPVPSRGSPYGPAAGAMLSAISLIVTDQQLPKSSSAGTQEHPRSKMVDACKQSNQDTNYQNLKQNCQPTEEIAKWWPGTNNISQSRVLLKTDFSSSPNDEFIRQPLQAPFQQPGIKSTSSAVSDLASSNPLNKGNKHYPMLKESRKEDEIKDSLLESVPMIRTLESRKEIIDDEFHGSGRVCIQDMSVVVSDLGWSKESYFLESQGVKIMKKRQNDFC